METWLFMPFVICLVKCQINHNTNALVVLDVLKKIGQKQKPEHVRNPVKQFVSVIVLPEKELIDSSRLNTVNLEPRVRVQFNEKREHGENIILEKYLPKMIDEMKNNCSEKKCPVFVVLFSWYIPCSLQGHECAKKLQDFVESKQYTLIVGFSEIFVKRKENRESGSARDNVNKSIITLNYPKISVYYLINYYSGQIAIHHQYDKPITNLSEIFQSNMYDCIIQKPISFCCGSNYNQSNPDLTNLTQVDQITAFGINTMVHFCKQSDEHSYSLTDALKERFKQWIKDNIGTITDCKKCWSNETYEYSEIALECMNRAFATSTCIENPENYKNTSKIKCIDKHFLPRTFCTKKKERRKQKTCRANQNR